MTNFIFKSQGTYKKLANQLEVILNEQRHQRSDLAGVLYLLKQLRTDLRLVEQTEKYYSKDHVPSNRFDEMSPDGSDSSD